MKEILKDIGVGFLLLLVAAIFVAATVWGMVFLVSSLVDHPNILGTIACLMLSIPLCFIVGNAARNEREE